MRDKARREAARERERFEIDEAARQLSRDEAQAVLTASAKEIAKETSRTPGEFPSTPKGKAPATKPTNPDDDSSSSSSDSESDMSSEAGPSHTRPEATVTAKMSFKPPSPNRFTGEGEDLKPEAFDRWYNSVRLYLNLSGIAGSPAGSGNYWILYTEGKAQEAAHQLLQEHGDDITQDELVAGLWSIF